MGEKFNGFEVVVKRLYQMNSSFFCDYLSLSYPLKLSGVKLPGSVEFAGIFCPVVLNFLKWKFMRIFGRTIEQ